MTFSSAMNLLLLFAGTLLIGTGLTTPGFTLSIESVMIGCTFLICGAVYGSRDR